MDAYSHVRVLFSIIVALGISQLLSGIARIVQHPKQYRVYWVHLTWVLYLFLYLIHFWWWEFRLSRIVQWTFELYVFVILYATLLYLLCSLLIPARMTDYESFQDYFYSLKGWIFSLVALLYLMDLGDSLVKGVQYFQALGFVYYFRTAALFVLSLITTKVNHRKFQECLVIFALLCEAAFIVTAHLRFG